MSARRYTSKNLAGGPLNQEAAPSPKPHHSRGRFPTGFVPFCCPTRGCACQPSKYPWIDQPLYAQIPASTMIARNSVIHHGGRNRELECAFSGRRDLDSISAIPSSSQRPARPGRRARLATGTRGFPPKRPPLGQRQKTKGRRPLATTVSDPSGSQGSTPTPSRPRPPQGPQGNPRGRRSTRPQHEMHPNSVGARSLPACQGRRCSSSPPRWPPLARR